MDSFRFLLASVWSLGPRMGVRYWRIYRATLADPSLVAQWETKCRWESAKLESEDPALSKIFDDWADALAKHRR